MDIGNFLILNLHLDPQNSWNYTLIPQKFSKTTKNFQKFSIIARRLKLFQNNAKAPKIIKIPFQTQILAKFNGLSSRLVKLLNVTQNCIHISKFFILVFSCCLFALAKCFEGINCKLSFLCYVVEWGKQNLIKAAIYFPNKYVIKASLLYFQKSNCQTLELHSEKLKLKTYSKIWYNQILV